MQNEIVLNGVLCRGGILPRFTMLNSAVPRNWRKLSYNYDMGIYSINSAIPRYNNAPGSLSYGGKLMFTRCRFLFGAYVEDILTKIFWSSSAILIFYTGIYPKNIKIMIYLTIQIYQKSVKNMFSNRYISPERYKVNNFIISTGLRAHHWMELIGSTFLVSSFVTFYFNRFLLSYHLE